MELSYVILARHTDLALDGTLSALGMDFERVRAAKFPVLTPLAVVAKLESSDFGDVSPPSSIRFDILGPDGKSILETPIDDMKLEGQKSLNQTPRPGKKKSLRVVLDMGGVLLPAAGEYEVHFEIAVHVDAGTIVFKKVLSFAVEAIDV